ncbi:uncharacterized protein TNCV_2413901 [Trichonephila clavipes]|nr:uncharacterized protein TNCV_2413901 [Trichonephila clavipes]
MLNNCVMHHLTGPAPGVMVWSGIGYYSRTPLVSIADGEHSGGGQRPPTSPPLPPRSREDLRLDGYLEYPYATKALYIYKHSCLLWDSNPVPTAQQSASLTTIPDGWREEY